MYSDGSRTVSESFSQVIPILPGIWMHPGVAEKVEALKEKLRDSQAKMETRGLDLGDLITIGLGPDVRWAINDFWFGVSLLKPGVLGVKFDRGLNRYGEADILGLGVLKTFKGIANFDKVTVVFKKGESDLQLLIHELLHALNNLTDRDFQDEFDISEDEEHQVKDNLSEALADIVELELPAGTVWNSWITHGYNNEDSDNPTPFTPGQLLAAGAMLREFKIKIGSTRYPASR